MSREPIHTWIISETVSGTAKETDSRLIRNLVYKLVFDKTSIRIT